MDIGILQSTYLHASWSNRKLFDTTAELAEGQLMHASVGSETIFDLLVHLVDVQRTWLARAQNTQTPHLDRAACSTLPVLREAWESVDAASLAYVAGLRADDLAEIVRYTNSKGEPQAYPRWQILLHQALHAAQHRSEVALLLTTLGRSTGWLDYLIYVDETRAAEQV